MSKAYKEIMSGSVGCNFCGAPDEKTWELITAHIRKLEDALSVLLPIVRDAKPKLDLSSFDRLLE